MTPQTPILDRQFKGVGRIKRATGSTSPKMRAALSHMLTALYNQGRLDVMRAIRDGKLELLVVYDAYRRHALDSLPMADTLVPLADSMRTWIVLADASPSYRESLATSLKYLIAEKVDAKVADLPALLESLRNTLGVKHPTSFNLCRRAASRFISATLKRNHPLWAAINAVEPRKVTERRKGKHLTIKQLAQFFPNRETDAVDGIAWSMALTGIHEKEYWHDGWEIQPDRIKVNGKKRGGRDRFVPLVLAPVVPTIHERTFTDKLRDRTSRFIQPYDLRRTFAHWMEEAGIPRSRRILYMGHKAKDVTDLYERQDVERFLKEDANRLRSYLNLSPTKSHTMRLEKTRTA